MVSSWAEVTPKPLSYTRAEALRTVQSLEGRFRDGNTGSLYSIWQAGDTALSLEIRGSRVVVEPEFLTTVSPVFASPVVMSGFGMKSPVVQYTTPKVEPTESVETNKYVLSAELPYKAIKGMALHVAPDSSGQSALIVDVEGGGWVLLIANSSEDVQLLHAALATLRQG